MKTRGFTLIEITAVVLILGVIFLVSYPTLENILKKHETDKLEANDKTIIEAAKTYFNMHSSEYEFTIGNKLIIDSERLLEDELVEESNIENINYITCTVATTKKLDCEVTKLLTYENGNIVYYNPETNNSCTKEEADTNVNDNGTTTGIKTGCMRWYAFNDIKGNTTVNLLLDHNTTPLVAWNSNNVNTEMLEVTEALNADIEIWNEQVKDTARLIGADEIAKITGNIKFNLEQSTTYFYFDTNTSQADSTINTAGASKYAWLFDNLYNCTSYGCNIEDNNLYNLYNSTSTDEVQGYWTSSAVYNSDSNVWNVGYYGRLPYNEANIDNFRGVRPVITVAKKTIS